ncbi:MAG: phosphonate ABC transporter substrate-binding protein [Hyphomicrobiales bacterium]|nr:MAG: phosphonate ABC transporter substrate-binding protein [Hyphomicrobiales bacterium]
MLRKLTGAALIAASLLSASFAQAADTVNFGIISTESSTNLKKTWQPFLGAMRKSTGLDIKAFFASDYAGVIEGMRFNKVQIAWFGNKSGMEAVDRSNGEVFAQTVDVSGNPGYWSLLITQKDSPINNLDDLMKCDKSINFGIGDPNSTSGFLVPTTYIFAARNIAPKECFKTVRNASHEVNALSVANDQVDVATNNTESMRRIEITKPDAFKKIKIIWKSPLIPSDPLVWRNDLDDGVKSKIYKFVMSYGRNGSPEEVEAARKVLAELQWAPFKPSSNAQLYPIRILAINKTILQIKGDKKMTAAEKETKIAELNVKAAAIEKLVAVVPSM